MPYCDDDKLFEQLAIANNKRDLATYTVIHNCFSDKYRFRIPSSMLPWDDISADELKELTEMFIEEDRKEETGLDQMPYRMVRVVVKSMRALYNSKVWRKRLW